MAILRQGLTLEQFLELPECKPALEYAADGEVTEKVSPKGQHSRLQFKIAEWFNRQTEPRRLALALPELRTTYAGASYVPDVAIYRWERIPRTPTGEIADDFFEPPDVAVEILSPRQALDGLVRHCQWYVDHGVRLALLVAPRDRAIVVFRPGASQHTLGGRDVVQLDELLPGLTLVVEEVFALLSLD
jgi:Uma2 family endonuclease